MAPTPPPWRANDSEEAMLNDSTTGTTDRREDVLRAALEVFGAKGYNKGSLASVAERAGMTRAGVLHHFGSKEGLLMAMLTYRDDTDVVTIQMHEGRGDQGFLDHLVDTVAMNVERPGVVQAYTLLSSESVSAGHPANAYFRQRLAALRAKLEGALLEVAGPGTDREAARDAASALIALMDGLQVQWLLDPTAVDMPRILAKVIKDVVNGISPSSV
ncbi:TetR/AcrR family transcriptional regulator [Specibacter sp. AOP5-B1-6]|uniref:TetR/AcrR family transcriptional regulator n=1 Tax=Specibacter sp. AOP5-B1-6 TaxID=3457653 RepID=UPI00402B7698